MFLMLIGLALLQAAAPKAIPPSLAVCNEVRIELGQTKVDVRNALVICCNLKTVRFPTGTETKEYPNQIRYEGKGGTQICNGGLFFDGSEKLIYVERILVEAAPMEKAADYVTAL